MNYIAVSIVIILTSITLGIAIYSRRWTRTVSEFYVAGRQISWLQNSLALTGDYLSAASFLGVAGAISILGIDKIWDALGYFGGYIVLLTLLAVPLRKIGKVSTPEILTTRYKNSRALRTGGMLSASTISAFYLVPQMIGAGALLQLLLGWDYIFAELVIGAIIVIYVVIGGMRATTYNQIIQGVVLWGAMFTILILTVSQFYGFNFGAVLSQAEHMIPPQIAASALINDPTVPDLATMNARDVIDFVTTKLTGTDNALTPGAFAPDWMNIFALAAGIVFGTAGLPHVLTRYYTVEKPKDARTSTIGVLFAIGTFYIMTIFVGLAAMYLLYPDLLGYFLSGEAAVAKNMAVPLLGGMVGGEVLLGIAIGGAFCAILSTVAGLLITIGTTVTHDFYKQSINPGADEKTEVRVAKLAIAVAGAIAVILGIVLQNQNVSFLVTLAFGMAASVFFPVLFLSVWWRKYTKEGALATMLSGLIVAIVFIAAQLAGMDSLLGIPVLVNPALYSLPVAIITGIVVSYVTDDVGDVDEFMQKAHSKE